MAGGRTIARPPWIHSADHTHTHTALMSSPVLLSERIVGKKLNKHAAKVTEVMTSGSSKLVAKPTAITIGQGTPHCLVNAYAMPRRTTSPSWTVVARCAALRPDDEQILARETEDPYNNIIKDASLDIRTCCGS